MSISDWSGMWLETALAPTPLRRLGSQEASGCCCIFVRRGSTFDRWVSHTLFNDGSSNLTAKMRMRRCFRYGVRLKNSAGTVPKETHK
jgi:hypothetical protein